MREILFKAKRKSDGKWVEGYLVPISYDTRPIGYEIINKDGINYDELDYYQPNFVSEMVEPETISQYIGLCDKNGRKIFENDIVAPQLPLITNIPFPVAYHNNQASFVGVYLDYEKSFAITKETLEKCEIIGNTFDNLELLEGGK